jgi:hypothetical protein
MMLVELKNMIGFRLEIVRFGVVILEERDKASNIRVRVIEGKRTVI